MAIQSEINTKIKCHSYLNKQNDMNIHVHIDKKKKQFLTSKNFKKNPPKQCFSGSPPNSYVKTI